ncbi:hypothetical protein pb186bvf_019354 [Paramecium bursaria]
MDRLQLKPAKLLYFTTELFKRKLIDDNERVQLKELIMQEEQSVYSYLDKYETNSNEQELSDQLINRVRNKQSIRHSGVLKFSDHADDLK